MMDIKSAYPIEIKTIGQLLDELVTVNQKIWHLIDRVEAGMASVAEAQAVQKWNARRNELVRAIDRRLGDTDIGEKIYS